MRFQGNFKIAAIAALGVLLLAAIAGAAVFALTLVQDTTEDTPVSVVGETAGAAVAPVQTVGSVASSPLDAEPAAANVATPTPSRRRPHRTRRTVRRPPTRLWIVVRQAQVAA